ncbi:hypothetical protein JCM3774_005861 [Rhodotorula dairenensis]
MSSQARLDLSDLDLPFQLPPPSHADRSPAALASAPPPSPHRPAPASPVPPRPSAPCSSHESFEPPHSDACACGCPPRARARPPTVEKSPVMARKKRASPADPPPPLAPAPSRRGDSSGSTGPGPDAPLKSLPWLHHDSPEPQPDQGVPYGTRSGRQTRSTPLKDSPKTRTGSLKIVLKAPNRPGPPPTLLPTPVSSASPPVVILDSSGATSEVSSRSQSPAIPPNAPATTSTPVATVTAVPTSHALSELGNTAAGPARAPSVERPSTRKGFKAGRDGLNRVCHHHKSQTDRPRMTCENAPTCRTVWCKGCVEKYYLVYTPNAQFEPGVAFACPVCQDACLCAGCKRKRRGLNREGRKTNTDDNHLVIALSIPASSAPTSTPEVATESKAEKRERKKKARESGNVAVDLWTPNGAGWDPSPLPDCGGSDSSDSDEDVSRMLIGDAVAPKDASVNGTGADSAASRPQQQPVQAPTPNDDDATLVAKRRSSLTSAYDRENPIKFPAAPPPPPLAPTTAVNPPRKKPVRIRQNKPESLRRSAAASAGRNRSAGGSANPSTPGAPQPPPADDLARYTTVSIFASATTPAIAAESAPTATYSRPRRNKRPSTAFDDYAVDFATSAAAGLVDRSASPGPASFAAAAAAAHAAGSSRRRGRGGTGEAGSRGSGISRLSIDMFAPSSRMSQQRRWRSDLSSASDCDGSAYYSSGDDDHDDADSDVDFAEAEGAGAVKPVIEQPLPVLAGLERNLGIEPPDGDGVEPGAEPLAFGEAFVAGVVAHGLLDEGGRRPRRSVRWIEGPERRKRRTMAAAAAAVPQDQAATTAAPAASAAESPFPAVKKESDPPVAVPEAPQTTRSVSPCDPYQLFSPPPLKRSTSLPPDSASNKLSPPKRKEDRPPPYDVARTSEAASAPDATNAANATAENRSAKDVKLAFALLDAVRAAVGSVIGSPSRGEGSSASAGIGAALQAALTTGHSSAASSRTPKAESDAMQLDSDPEAPSSADVTAAHDNSGGGAIDYQAHELEAKRRLEALAAQEQVDPGKAFKPTARDGAEAQLFIGSPACHVDADDEVVEAHLTGVKADPGADRKFGFEVSFRVSTSGTAAVDTPDFDTDSPIDDLWTPASVADSISTAPSTSASNSFGEDPLCGLARVPAVPVEADSPALVDEYPLFAAAVAGGGGGLTPPQGTSAVAIPRTPTRGLLASGALRGLEDLEVVGATGLTIPLRSEDTWMEERDTEIEAF